MEMAQLGATSKGGVCRLALTKEDIEARALLGKWATELSLSVSMDAMGNLFARREGEDRDAAPVMTGSHLDSQPTGGRFDGVFGVLAGLEAIEAMERAKISTRRPIELVSWTNEEGCRFTPGCTGSLAYRNSDDLASYLALTDGDGVSLAEAVQSCRKALAHIPERALGGPVSAFLEAHIEQGPILENAGKVIGVVTGIQGTRRFTITVNGEDAHAGTMPRKWRKDALSAAVAIVGALEELFHDPKDVVRFTVGRFNVYPNAPSVVPGKVTFTIDFRHPEDAVLSRLGDQVAQVCESKRKPCTVEVRELIRTPPINFPAKITGQIEGTVRRLGLSHLRVFSGAGHDSQNMFHLAPTGMVFVPCEKGISHNERENAKASDLLAGTQVLADVLFELANE